MQFQNAEMINYQLSQNKQQQFQQPATFGSYSGGYNNTGMSFNPARAVQYGQPKQSYNNVSSPNLNYMALNPANANMLARQKRIQDEQRKQSEMWNMTSAEISEKKRQGWKFLPGGTIIIPCAAHKNKVGAMFYGYPNMGFESKQKFIEWKKNEKKKHERKGGNVQQCNTTGRCFVDDSEGYEEWINGGRDTWIANLRRHLDSYTGSKPVAQQSKTFTTPGIRQNFTSNGNTFNL